MIPLPGRGLRVGIIGTGFMAAVHAAAVRASGATLAAVAGRTPARAAAEAARLGAESVVRDPQELLDRDDVDIVHVCTPNATHAALAAAVLESAKPVVCEKPLATTLRDAEDLARHAAGSGRVAAVPFVYRFYAAVREARQRVREGEAGRLWFLHGSYLQDWLADRSTTNWRVDAAAGGGSRAFGDIGVHWCDLAEFVTGQRITRLVARTGRAHDQRGVPGLAEEVVTEDGAALLFETDEGALGSLAVSQVAPGRQNRLWFSFDGTEASYLFDQEQPEVLQIGRASGNIRVPVGASSLRTEQGRRYARLPSGHPEGYQDAFNAFVSDTYLAVRGEQVDGLPTFADGLRAARITHAVLQSAASGGWTDVATAAIPATSEGPH